jgi:hypothetical protein
MSANTVANQFTPIFIADHETALISKDAKTLMIHPLKIFIKN